MAEPSLVLKHHRQDDFADVERTLVDVYVKVYAENLHDPFFSVGSFTERLQSHSSSDGWEVVIGYSNGVAIGYAYGAPLAGGTGWWSRVDTQLDPLFIAETGRRTLALFELMVVSAWRGTGTALRIHDELLRQRHEERVSLYVERDHPRVKALYERWGYESIGTKQPFPDAPFYYLMWRPLQADGEHRGITIT